MTLVDRRTRARRRIANTALAILKGEVSYLEGTRLILENRGPAELPDDDPDITAFALIESETENLPFASRRQHWSREALESKAAELFDVVARGQVRIEVNQEFALRDAAEAGVAWGYSEHDRALDRPVQRSQEARLDFCRPHHDLCLHAGHGPGQRPRRNLDAPMETNEV